MCPPPPDSLTPGFPPYCPSQEPIFPSALKLDTLGLDSQHLVFRGPRWPSPPDLLLPRLAWYRPTSLQQLLALRHQHPGAKVVVGNTELGVEVKFKHCDYPVYLCPTAVEDMARVGTEFLHLNFVFPDHRD